MKIEWSSKITRQAPGHPVNMCNNNCSYVTKKKMNFTVEFIIPADILSANVWYWYLILRK